MYRSLCFSYLENMLSSHESRHINREELISVLKIWAEKVEQPFPSELSRNIGAVADHENGNCFLEVPLDDNCPLNVSTHSTDSTEKGMKREYNDMADRLAAMSQLKRGLEDENSSLQALLKEHEETINTVSTENEQLKKTIILYEKKMEYLQNVQQEFEETNVALRKAETDNKELKSKLQLSERYCATLQQKLDYASEQKCEANEAFEKLTNSLAGTRKELSLKKEAYEDLKTKYETAAQTFLEKISACEEEKSDLEIKNKILNENKSELELKLAFLYEESANVKNSWRTLLSDSSYGSSSQEQSQEMYYLQFCSNSSCESYRRKTLHSELQASGDLCLTHKQLEDQLREYQEMVSTYKQELMEYKENEKIASGIVETLIELLKQSDSDSLEDSYENDHKSNLMVEVKNAAEFLSSKKAFSYLTSFTKGIFEMDHLFQKSSGQHLLHPKEVSTQTFNPCVEMSTTTDISVAIHENYSQRYLGFILFKEGEQCPECPDTRPETPGNRRSPEHDTSTETCVAIVQNRSDNEEQQQPYTENYMAADNNHAEEISTVDEVKFSENSHVQEEDKLQQTRSRSCFSYLFCSRWKRNTEATTAVESRVCCYKPPRHVPKPFKISVPLQRLRRLRSCVMVLFIIFMLIFFSIHLLVGCCLYNPSCYANLCFVIEDIFKPYVTLRHLSPPPI